MDKYAAVLLVVAIVLVVGIYFDFFSLNVTQFTLLIHEISNRWMEFQAMLRQAVA